jgi:hypothetical protein
MRYSHVLNTHPLSLHICRLAFDTAEDAIISLACLPACAINQFLLVQSTFTTPFNTFRGAQLLSHLNLRLSLQVLLSLLHPIPSPTLFISPSVQCHIA